MPLLRVRLFDGPALERDGEETVRFRSAKVAALLAFLALRLGRRCPREEIAEALWPDEDDPAVVANRLRVTLASLRRQLEPPGTPFGAVLDAGIPGCLILREAAVACDVQEFERAHAAGRLDEAAALLRGPLLPGIYDEWVRDAQLRFEMLREELPSPPAPLPSGGEGLGVRGKAATPEGRGGSPSSSRLPLYLTRFIGREEDRARLLAALAGARLVTLTGPGGIGKTRLAVETALGAGLPVVFATLAGAADLGDAILRAFGVASRSLDAPVETLLALLRDRPPTLLVLDDADGCVEAVAELVPRLLAESPALRLLVTSRQRLEIAGETVVAVPPMPLPPADVALDDLPAYPSAALFLDRARGAVPDFAVRERHLASVVAILRRLEGMPLALELAAARVAVQSPAGIAEALEENAMSLRSRQRGLSERHRSLRAAIEGSVEALEPDLQRFFARLSVFRGGWTVSAARAVGDAPDAEARIEDLVVRSLVTMGEDRYAFLEPIRAFAAEMLSSEEAEAARLRHAAFFRSLAAAATEDDIQTLRPLDAEEENLRMALSGRDDDLRWAALAGALTHAFVRGGHRQALRWIEDSADAVVGIADPKLRFRWRYAAGQILPDVGRFEEAEALARAMRADAEGARDARGAVHADVLEAYVQEARGDVVAALALGAEALARARRLDDRNMLESCLSHRSGTLHVFGAGVGADTDLGRAALAEAEALARELRERVQPFSRRLPLAPLLLAAALWPQGRLEEAYGFFKEAQAAAVALGTTTELMYGFVSEAAIAAEWGQDEHAALLYGAFLTLRERMGYSLARAQSSRPPWIEALAEGLRSRLGEEAFDRLAAAGRTAPPAEIAARHVGQESL